jgi:hypothetical protein
MARPRSGLTFSHVVIAAIASGLTYITLRHPALIPLMFAVVLIPTVVWVLVMAVFTSLNGLQCPACGARGLRRYAISSFGFRYFRCEECGTKCKRSLVGHWFDASGRADQAVYRAKDQKDPWGDGPVATVDKAATGTHAVLLRNKLGRRPESDNLMEP